MYRYNCLLGKTSKAILSSRYYSVPKTNTRRLQEVSCCIRSKGRNGRLLSTISRASGRNRLYLGCAVAMCPLAVGSVTLISKYNDGFREVVEEIPGFKYIFRYALPPKMDGASLGHVLTTTHAEEEVQAEHAEQIPHVEKKDDDFVVINVLDAPSPSQIDFELGKEHTVKEEDEIIKTENDLLVTEEEEVQAQEIIEETANDLPVLTEEVQVQEVEGESIHKEHISLSVEKGGASLIDVEVGQKLESEIVGSEILESSVTPTEVKDEIPDELSKINIQQQIQILTAAYENLKIILDDTITTKTSAAGMLHGYITQFGQALLVPRGNLTYESIWDAISVLEHSVHESIDLVRAKETEVNSQVKNLKELICNIREYELSDIADKTEKLIVSSNESLYWVESEIELLTNKLNILLGFQRQLEGSPEKLQKYLNAFIPDFIKLLNSKEVDIQNLCNEDALLLLTLRRTELVYAEVQEKEAELNIQFEATLKKEGENIRKEATEHLNTVIEKLEADKNNELNEKVNDLERLHKHHLQKELEIQYEAHQQEICDANAKLESELTAQLKTELESMLDEQEGRHYHEIMNNLSYLRGIESKISDVLDVDMRSKKNQHLWAAVLALNIALNDISENGRTKELIPEISDILQCKDNDNILSTILSTVPKYAVSSGVIPENTLIQHFNDIKPVCMRVAMVKDEGASVFAYAFSYIKSLFVFSRFYQRHVLDEVDLESLGPYEILEKADYYIQQGDLEQAAKFISQLKGVPKKLCTNWLKEVRLLLETKQSMDLLMAYVIGSLIAGFE